jgi:D-glycero-alpha-D-manno-heptose 1-phosphate guanylyltransferase
MIPYPKFFMKAAGAILCGGLGTRIHQIAGNFPKCLLPVVGIPFLSLLASKLRSEGFKDLIAVGGHYIEALQTFILRESSLDIRVVIQQQTGTANAVRAALNHFHSVSVDIALIVNGDTILDIDYSNLLSFHTDNQSDITIVTTTRDDVQNRGAIEIDDQTRRVMRFAEGSTSHSNAGQSNCGSYLLDVSKCTAWFNSETWSSLEREALPSLLHLANVYAYCNHDRFVWDFGTPDRFNLMNEMTEKIRQIYALD